MYTSKTHTLIIHVSILIIVQTHMYVESLFAASFRGFRKAPMSRVAKAAMRLVPETPNPNPRTRLG